MRIIDCSSDVCSSDLKYWFLTMFYVMAELWGSIVLQVLFWGFANEITRISEATRFYSVLGIGSNIAAIVAGQVAVKLSIETLNPSRSEERCEGKGCVSTCRSRWSPNQ